jgi:hypothetical protein
MYIYIYIHTHIYTYMYIYIVRKAEKFEVQIAAHKFSKHPEKREAAYPGYKRKVAINLEIGVLLLMCC